MSSPREDEDLGSNSTSKVSSHGEECPKPRKSPVLSTTEVHFNSRCQQQTKEHKIIGHMSTPLVSIKIILLARRRSMQHTAFPVIDNIIVVK